MEEEEEEDVREEKLLNESNDKVSFPLMGSLSAEKLITIN